MTEEEVLDFKDQLRQEREDEYRRVVAFMRRQELGDLSVELASSLAIKYGMECVG